MFTRWRNSYTVYANVSHKYIDQCRKVNYKTEPYEQETIGCSDSASEYLYKLDGITESVHCMFC